jgi:uncharacterized protein (UPF0212 family)
MLINLVKAAVSCPRCGEGVTVAVEVPLDGAGPRNSYSVGDVVRWSLSATPSYEGRPSLGTISVEGYVVCPSCDRDFFVDVVVVGDVIQEVRPNLTKPGYLGNLPS